MTVQALLALNSSPEKLASAIYLNQYYMRGNLTDGDCGVSNRVDMKHVCQMWVFLYVPTQTL